MLVHSKCQMKMPDGTKCGKQVALFFMGDVALKNHDPDAVRCASCRQGGAARAREAAGFVRRPHGRTAKKW